MNTLEDAFLDSLASRLVVEDTAQAKEATQVAQADTKPRSIIEQQIGTPEEILASAKPETAAGIAKGMVQGFVGLPGDLVSVVRGLYEFGRTGGDLDGLLAGLEKPTGLPTTEDVKKFLDELGLKVGTGEGTPEKVGEFAAPGGYIKGAKAAAKATKKTVKKVTEKK
jgi:hypothetical protein